MRWHLPYALSELKHQSTDLVALYPHFKSSYLYVPETSVFSPWTCMTLLVEIE